WQNSFSSSRKTKTSRPAKRPLRYDRLHAARKRSPIRLPSCPPRSKNNFEELNTVPFSGVVRIERGAVHPGSITGRRPRIEHLERVTAGTKCSRNHSFNRGPLQKWRRGFHRAHRFLRPNRWSVFLCSSDSGRAWTKISPGLLS